MATYRYLVYDISSILKQNSATSQIELSQITFWVQTISNTIASQEIVTKGTGKYLEFFTNIPIQINALGRKYIDLPKSIFDIQNEGAVSVMSFSQDGTCPAEWLLNPWQRTNADRAWRLELTEYEKPSPSNVYFYRSGEQIYILGIETVPIPTCEGAFYTSFNMRTNTINLDDQIPLSDEQINLVRQEVLKLGTFMLAQPGEQVNDAVNEVQQPARK